MPESQAWGVPSAKEGYDLECAFRHEVVPTGSVPSARGRVPD